jgi:hypothetical protein
VNLGEWARQQDIHPQTAYRWFRTGTLPVPARKMGKLILVGDLEARRVRAASVRASKELMKRSLDLTEEEAWELNGELTTPVFRAATRSKVRSHPPRGVRRWEQGPERRMVLNDDCRRPGSPFRQHRIRRPFVCAGEQARRKLGAPATQSRQDVSNLIAVLGKEGR